MRHARYLIAALAVAVLLAILFAARRMLPGLDKASEIARPGPVHVYRDLKRKLDQIQIYAVYAVPRDRVKETYGKWQDDWETVLAEAGRFHELQFSGRSELSRRIFPRPIVLEQNGAFYDVPQVESGKSEAVRPLYEEIERRVIRPDGDLYDSEYALAGKDAYPVIAILYEGVGGSGAPGVVLLSSSYFSDPTYQPFRSALFYHEFGHALGLPDLYDTKTGTPFSDGIMGRGRERPLAATYLEPDLRKEMQSTLPE
ncbi:MAG: hypothetical protein HY978_01920 [Candidatus Liptonbacteria bacterium]|nr:hypothetical protein [Candidatus Liptonbacteria bacterium]